MPKAPVRARTLLVLFLFRVAAKHNRRAASVSSLALAAIIDVVSQMSQREMRSLLFFINCSQSEREREMCATRERQKQQLEWQFALAAFSALLCLEIKSPYAHPHQRVSRVAASTSRAQTRKSCCCWGYRRCIVMCLVAFQSAAKCVSRRGGRNTADLKLARTDKSRSLAAIKILPIRRVCVISSAHGHKQFESLQNKKRAQIFCY